MTDKSALLIIDMLNDFVREGAPLEVPETRKVIPHIDRKVSRAREEGIPVIYICDKHREDNPEFKLKIWPPHAVAGTKGAEVVEELKPLKGDHIVTKENYSGFFQTDLDKLLKKLKVDHLILTGCVTNICILYTAADAMMRGYSITVPSDCVAGLNKEDHDFALRQMKAVLRAEVI